MDATPNGNEEPKAPEKDSPPLGNPPADPQANQVLEPAPDMPVRHQNITGQPSDAQHHGEEEGKMGEFERLTLRWTRLNVIVIAATLIAIVGSAVVFWDQFKEMASQTDLLAISARQARRDSVDSAITTQKQLDIARKQATALEDQVRTLRSNFAKEQRPIITGAIVKPYLQPLAPIRVDIFGGNYGKSVALRTKGRGYIFWGKSALSDAYKWFNNEAMQPYPKDVGGIIIPPGIPVNENAPDAHRSTLLSGGTISKTDLDWIMANDFSAVIVSRQDYFDQLGHHYWTEGCWSHFASGAIPQCPKHNEVH